MNQRVTYTQIRVSRLWKYFKNLNDEGITIIQVTWSEKNARFGKRIVRVADGAVVADEHLTVNV